MDALFTDWFGELGAPPPPAGLGVPEAPSDSSSVQFPGTLTAIDDQDCRANSAFGQPSSRKRKALTLRDSDWEPIKDRLIQLYVREKLTLAQVAEIVNNEFNLQPPRTYVDTDMTVGAN